MPADRRPQPWEETRSPALARLPFLMGAEGEAGQDGWQAAPPGQRLLTDRKRRRSPRLNRKSAGAAAGPRGAPRAPLPRAPGAPRARRSFARPLPLARPPPFTRPLLLARPAPLRARGSPRARRLLADSREPPGGKAGGRGQAEGGRRPRLRHPGREGRAEKQTWPGSWRPRAGRGAGGPLERAESPARPSIVPLFLCSCFSAHSSRSHPQTRSLPESESAPPTPQPGLAGRPGLMSVLLTSVSAPARAAWALSSSCNFSLPIDGSCGFQAAGSLGRDSLLPFWRG
nr:synapsin-1-like [Mirounga angustirostris]XP_054362538.1 synapsin-1-like [Mirounga angustirostris]